MLYNDRSIDHWSAGLYELHLWRLNCVRHAYALSNPINENIVTDQWIDACMQTFFTVSM